MIIPTLEELLGNDSTKLPGELESINISSIEEILPSCAFPTQEGRRYLKSNSIPWRLWETRLPLGVLMPRTLTSLGEETSLL